MEAANISIGASGMFRDHSGAWATRQLKTAMSQNRQLSVAELRDNATLRRDEWVVFDRAVIEEGQIRLAAVQAMISAGLVIPVANAMGKTFLEYEKVSEMNAAAVSLDGMSRDQNDIIEFDPSQLPLPLVHKDFWINLRKLSASRNGGEALDTMQARSSTRRVIEAIEAMFFQGYAPKFKGTPIYGYMTLPEREEVSWTGGGSWTGSKTGAQVLADVLKAKARLEANRFYGPYALFVPAEAAGILESDYKDQSDKTIRQRVLEVDGIKSITVCDQLPAGNVILVQLSVDVTALVNGIPPTTIQWDEEGGMRVNFKVMALQIPLIRSTYSGVSGVAHLSASGT